MDRGITFQKTITMITENCYACGVLFAMPSDFVDDLRRNKTTFYCPNGHSQAYTTNEADRLKRQLEEERNKLAQEQAQKIQLESELLKAQRKLKRVHNGTCPCCKRSFENLRKHMETKHPELLTKSPTK